MSPRARFALLSCSVLVLLGLLSADARATVVQVDGTIVPVLNTGGGCEGGDLQACFNAAAPLGEGVAPPNANAIYAILDAAQLPEIFLPDTASVVTFRDIAEGAGFENSFGYYNVGDDPTNTANLRPIMGCGVTAAQHANEVPNYAVNAERGTTVTVSFATELSAGRYRGGYIAFYLMTPEGRGSAPNCGDFVAGSSYQGRVYFTQRDLNNDGDFVHHLVYQSRLEPRRFYFGFEDLFRGGDNDYEDMAMQVTGLVPPCIPSAEVCDGRDNDCDGSTDEGTGGAACTCDGSGGLTCEGGNRQGACQTGETACVAGTLLCRSTVTPSAELCNGIDDNCNGTADDSPAGTGVPCDGTDTDLCDEGTTQCTAGTLVCGDNTGPNDELCNLIDDDCDGTTDESPIDVGGPCDGADSDLCQEGVFVCGASGRTCSDTSGNDVELCNGADDDCDGTPDDSPIDVGVACSVGIGLCQRNGATQCVAGSPVCSVTPGTGTAERCNGIDDDCDGATDEDFNLGTACVAPGECGPGVIECSGQTATRCSSAPGGSMSGSSPETCNGLDDDCDGSVDEGLTNLGSCGSAVGECSPGVLQCIAAAPTCVGGISASPEICNGLDDDCDGTPDERGTGGLTDEGGACGNGVGACEQGTETCVSGMLQCVGEVGPTAELCNAIDDDCDGVADEDPTDVGASCGTSDVGVCELGRTICVAGAPVCNGATEPNIEVCNNLDDDCDGTVDDDPADVGRTCGSAMGTCMPGTTVCSPGGVIECQGGTVGVPEICNGIDDDCNNIIDDDPSDAGGPCGESEGVCEEGIERCINGALQCVGGTMPGTEVCNGLDDDCDGEIDEGDLCEGGECRNGMCSLPCEDIEFGCAPGFNCVNGFCLEDLCFGVNCPRGADGTRNVCEGGSCVPICDTITGCAEPNVCRRTDGACVGNNCTFLPYLCAEGEVCIASECVSDPCVGVTCDAGEFCREGSCVGSCAGVTCEPTQQCRGGACEPTGCTEDCGRGRVCDAMTGTCVTDRCGAIRCDTGLVCDPTRGACIADPCRFVTCPSEGEICRLGECISGGAGTDAGPPRMDGGTGPDLVVATGGCSVGARTSSRGVWLFMLLGVVALASRRRRAGGSLLAVLLAAPLAAGCAVDPYCLANCDAGPGGPDSAVDAEVADAQPGDARVFQDGCLVGAPEECNDFDDNCNGLIDEGFDLTSDEENCGACGTSCVRPGARIECQDSECTFVACFDSYYVQDGEDALTDGCNYRCFVSNGGVEACDTLDNDCDQSTDEDFDLQNDELNCGRCGQECRFFRTTTATCDMGTCRFDPMTDCEPGYIDRDGMQDTGCEFECTPTGDEICDGLDNDCDGMTDEDFNLDSSITDCGRCGRACSFPNATPHCTTGTCGFDPMVDCAPGHSDRNGVQLDGCEYPCVPTADPTEICDGLDNDCNGIVDGATTDSGGACSNAPGGVATGICTATGALTCSNATLICVGAPEPTRETCNGADDDCDGVVDDAPADEGRVCAPPIGTCTVGLSVCNSGRLDCVRTVEPTAEICNGLDDDCDGGVDDGPTDASIGTACGTDVGECAAGTFQCDPSGRIVCAGGAGAVLETCNGLDDDCDGTADDDPVDAIGSCGSAVGACVQGSLSCSGGTVICTGGIGPSAETCNNQDDNCDGTTDESITAACYTGAPATRGMGLCRDGASTCAAGTMSACAGQVLPALETCDNRDEDCDGTADDGVTQSCYTFSSGTPGVGICRTGVQSCSAGVFTGACAGEIGPAAEACNNTDDDCDGSTDEASGGGPLTQSCYTGPGGTAGVGTCRTGTQTCSVGAFGSCIGDVVPAREWCGDTLDTDCDARSDTMEGCLSPGTELRLDGPASGSGSGQQTAPGAAHSFDVAMASAGNPGGRNVYVVWSDLRNGNADVFFLRSTDGGNTWGTILNLTSGLGDRAVQPVVAAAYDASISNDRVYVAYQRVSGGIRHVRVARSSDSGASFTDSGDLDTTATTDNFKHRLAVSPNGQRVVLAWEQLRTDDLTRRILSRASTNSGGTFAAERLISVNGGAAPNAGKPQVAVTSSGRFVWVWRERRAPRTTFDIFATYSDDATTTPPGAREARIDSDPGDNRDVNELRIAGDGNHLYLLYRDLSTVTTGDSDIVFARSTNDGGAWTSQRTLDDPSGEVSSSTSPAIAIDPGTAGTGGDERVYAVWIDTREGTQVYLSGSNDAGATFQPPVRASNANGQAVSGIVAAPVVAFAGSSTLIVAYTNGAAGATSVRAASSPDGGATWNLTDPALNTVTRNSDSPAIAAFSSAGTPSLGAVVTWVDFRSGTFQNGDIYRVRVGR